MGRLVDSVVTSDPEQGGGDNQVPGPKRSPWTRRVWRALPTPSPKLLILGGVILLLAWLCVGPLAYLVWVTVVDDGRLSLDSFGRAYSNYSEFGELVWNTGVFTIGSTVLGLVLGIVLAFLTERTNVPFRRVLFTCAVIPLIVPGVLYTISWIFLLSPRIGIYNTLSTDLFGFSLLNIFSMPGMIIVQGFDSVSLCYLLMVATFRFMDPSLEESATMSGASLPRIFFRISVPLARPGIYASALILGVKALSTFEVPALMGIPEGIWVLTSRIYSILDLYPLDVGQIGALSLTLFAVCALGIYAYARLSRNARGFQTISGKGYRPARISLGRWRLPVFFGAAFYYVISLLIPSLIIFYMSTQSYYSTPSIESLGRMTWANYQFLFRNDQVVDALKNSVVLGVLAATVTMLLVGVAAWFLVRTKVPGRQLVDHVAFVPMVFPGLVLGVAILFIYANSPIPVHGTLWIMLIAYVAGALPYGMRTATVSMYQISNELEEAAEMSGASWPQMFRRITLPLLAPGIAAGWIYIFMTSLKELSTPIVLYQPGTEVLALRVWNMWNDGHATAVSALGTLMIGMLAVLALLVRLATRSR